MRIHSHHDTKNREIYNYLEKGNEQYDEYVGQILKIAVNSR